MRNYLVLLYIVCLFSVFFLTPISIFADIYIHIFSLLGFISFFTSKLYKHSILKFTFLTVTTLLLLSISSSVLYLKQDVFSAIIATQYLIKGFSIIYIYKLYISRKIDLDKIFKYLITTIWIFTVFLVIATLTQFSFTFISPISGQQLEITASKYSKDLLYFGEFYFLAKYFQSNRSINLIYLLVIFISTQLADIQRGDIIFFSATFFISLILFRKKAATVKIYFLLPIFILLGFLFINYSSSSDIFKDKFTQLAMVFDAKESDNINDPSIFVRLKEIQFALNGFFDHPITGNGLIRSSKKAELIGDVYFYPVDAGMFGVLYTFGLAGIYFYFLLIRRLLLFKFSDLNTLSAGLFLFLVYNVLYSFKDGELIFNISKFLFCYMVIYLIVNYNDKSRINEID